MCQVTNSLYLINGSCFKKMVGGAVLREKLKMIKEALKEWHVTHSKGD